VSARIKVLESFAPPHERTNPYCVLLFDSFPEVIDADHFTWRRALTGDFDVFHLHWPEVKVRSSSAMRSTLRGAAFLLLLFRIRITGRALVRTLHDAAPHERPTVLQRWVLRLCDRWTTLWITLTDVVVPPTSAPVRIIPHGHYRDWFEPPAGVDPTPGRLLHFGQLRPYKGTTPLVEAFMALRDEDLSLHIAGATPGKELEAALRTLCARDDRVRLRVGYLPDEDLRREILASELVVLPYLNITNSGSLLLALSLDRPVLASAAPAVAEVAGEVGPGWVQLFHGPISSETLQAALSRLRRDRPTGRPDLSSREWEGIGAAHARAFEDALRIVGRT
jgi:beta-1,4-mannosyltransferase